MLRTSKTIWLLAIAPALAAVLSVAAAGEERADAVQTKVEAFQASLKAAWEADDRDGVLAHFQHGGLLPPTRSEYRMLGRMSFWDRPLKQATRQSDGTIHAEFVMDPESDSPAQIMTLTFIEDPDGRLLVKSEVTPEQLTPEQLAAELQARPQLQSKLFPYFQKWFWEWIDKQKPRKPLPAGFRESLVLRPLGEIHRGDRAALFVVMGAKEMGGGVEAWAFERRGGSWELVEEDPLERPEGVERFLGDSGERQVVRRAALTLEQVPAFYRYLLGAARERYKAAIAAGDFAAYTDLVEMALAGLPLVQVNEWHRELDNRPQTVDLVRLGKNKVDGEQAIVSLEVESEGRMELENLLLTREGEDWVIEGPYTTPSEETQAILRYISTTLVAVNTQESGALPAAADMLPFMAEMGFEDGWGTPLRYAVSEDGTRYRILSAGADKTFNHDDWAPAPGSLSEPESSDLNEDIVFENGHFVRWHKKGIW